MTNIAFEDNKNSRNSGKWEKFLKNLQEKFWKESNATLELNKENDFISRAKN